MAAVHVANMEYFKIAQDGSVYQSTDTTKTIKQALNFTNDWRIVVDSNIPNSANNPTLSQYLNLEVAAGFVPVQVLNTMVITYHA